MKYLLIGLMTLVSISSHAKDEACLKMVVESENLSLVSSFLKANKVDFKLQSNHTDSTVLFQKGSTLTIFTRSSSDVRNKLKGNDIIQSMEAETLSCDMYRGAIDILKL